MIETHAHIYDAAFDDDRVAMIQRAQQIGVEQIWMPNCNSQTIQPMLALADTYPGYCKPMMGLHPCYVKAGYEQELERVGHELETRKYMMIGEIGLDYYWDLEFVGEQEYVFKRHLEWARQYNLPICIHSRNARQGVLNAIVRCCELIEAFNWVGLRGIFHCFSGEIEEAQRIKSLHFKLGIGGAVTFKRGILETVLPYLKPEDIVLETDSPYLTPMPYRGKRNEVAYIDYVAERVAELMGATKETIVRKSTENAKALIEQPF